MRKITKLSKKPPSEKQYLIFIDELENNPDFLEQHKIHDWMSIWQPVVDKMNKKGPKKNIKMWKSALENWEHSVREKFQAIDPNETEALKHFSEVQRRLLLALGQLSVNSCRGCNTKSSEENILYPLFEDMKNGTKLTEKARIYKKITRFKILKSDMLPHWLCSDCWNKCEEWHSFLRNCKGYDEDKYKNSLNQSNKNMFESKTVQPDSFNLSFPIKNDYHEIRNKPLKKYASKKGSQSKPNLTTNITHKNENDYIDEILINHCGSPDISNLSFPMENDYHDNSNELDCANSDPFESIFIKEESSDNSEFNNLELPKNNSIDDNKFADLPPLGFAIAIKLEPEDMEHDATLDIIEHNESDDGVGDNDENLADIKDQKLIENPIEIKNKLKIETQRKSLFKYQCDICNKFYEKKSYLLNHLLAHVKSEELNKEYLKINYECFVCRVPFKDLRTLKGHVLVHGPRDIKHKHMCKICGKSYPKVASLNIHIKRHDPSSKSICIDCGKSFPAPENLALHNKRYMGKPDHPSLPADFDLKSEYYMTTRIGHSCKICNKKFKTRTNLRDHEYSHTKSLKKYICFACGISFREPNLLLTHQRTHNIIPELFSCTKCNKQFNTTSLLRAHSKTHTEQRPFVCSFKGCNKSFKANRYFQIHNRVHTGARPFSCDICNMTFLYFDVFKRHKRIHTDME